MPEQFNISMDRVDKIPVPLLVIGLGGTGCDTLITVKRTFAERFKLPTDQNGQTIPVPVQTAYLGIDTQTTVPNGLDQSEYLDITFSGLEKVLRNQVTSLSPEETQWVNSDLCTAATGMGAGTVRQAARLMLSRRYDDVIHAVDAALTKISQRVLGAAGVINPRIEVMIITGIGGGTGSGTFLDVAQIVRNAKNIPLPIYITGYIVMPDVSISNAKNTPGMFPLIKHNAYAALKELDFWMRVKEHGVRYSMCYGASRTNIEWKAPPFDQCVLISGTDVHGTPIMDGYNAIQLTIAENLLHYMAAETIVAAPAGNGNAAGGGNQAIQYSYRNYEDNLRLMAPVQTYPAEYTYRTIGAFTKRIPKKPILYYEGTKLLATFIPGRDAKGHLQPNKDFFTDGQSVARTQKIIGDRDGLFQAFCTNGCTFPDECFMDLGDNATVYGYQNEPASLHCKLNRDNWVTRTCAPAALETSKVYFNDAWGRFVQFATAVITDPQKGPFALRLYLEAHDGLLHYLKEALTKWKSVVQTIEGQLTSAAQHCDDSWPNFQHPPFLGKMKALKYYVDDLNTLYNKLAEQQFMLTHVDALKKLILRIEEYLKDGLNPLCTTILYLEKQFAPVGNGGAVNQQYIFQLTNVQAAIDATFTKENINLALTRTFLERLATISLKNEPNADPHTSGMSFVCQKEGLWEISKQIQSDLQKTFGDVNGQSLDDIMIANVGNSVNPDETRKSQEKWMHDLADGVVSSAIPMFKLDTTFGAEEQLSYSYMSIPDNAPKHMNYIQGTYNTSNTRVEPKSSTLTDHIYCLVTFDKFPLYRYADMEDLRAQYEEDLHMGRAPGMHLVCTGIPGSDYTSDWSLLPSPKPFFLFPNNGYIPPKEQKLYQKVDDLTERALRCGMLTVVDTEKDKVIANVLIHYFAYPTTLATAEGMKEKADEIAAETNPVTGTVYPDKIVSEKLKDYLKEGEISVLKTEVNPLQLAGILNLVNVPHDPFDPNTINNPNNLKIAQANYRKLCIAMTKALIYRRPDILLALERQVPAFEEIHRRIESTNVTNVAWDRRKQYAPKVADMFILLHNEISLGLGQYEYMAGGQYHPIINNANFLSPELNDIPSFLLKTAGFLADVGDENGSKADLTQLLSTKETDNQNKNRNKTLTVDDCDEFIKAATRLISLVDADKTKLENIRRSDPAQTDRMNSAIAVLEGIKTKAQDQIDTYQQLKQQIELA